MNRLIEWLRGWSATLDMMIFDRKTYRLLRDWSDGPECNLCPTPCSGCPKWER